MTERLPWEDEPSTDEPDLALIDSRVLDEGDRQPYVGTGADGCIRSARIDREEIDGLDRDDPRVELLEASAARWEAQAARCRQLDAEAEERRARQALGPKPLAEILEDADTPPDVFRVSGVVEHYAGAIDRETVRSLLDTYAGAHVARMAVIGKATDAVLDVVRGRADARRGDRPDVDKLTPSDVRREIVGAADDAEVLDAFASVFTRGAKEARGIAGDVVGELPGRGGAPRRSVKVGDGDGFELSVSVSARTELSVDVDEVVEVMISYLLASAQAATSGDEGPLSLKSMPAKVYAEGARDAVAMLRGLLSSSPTFRSTALDALVKSLENLDDDTLARRLRTAYGKVEKGDPTVKVDRKPLEAEEATS